MIDKINEESLELIGSVDSNIRMVIKRHEEDDPCKGGIGFTLITPSDSEIEILAITLEEGIALRDLLIRLYPAP